MSPEKYAKEYEMRRLKQFQRSEMKQSALKSRRKLKATPDKRDQFYWNSAQNPYLPDKIFKEKGEFLDSLKKSYSEIKKFETQTRMQRESILWREEKRNLLTAFVFWSDFPTPVPNVSHSPSQQWRNRQTRTSLLTR